MSDERAYKVKVPLREVLVVGLFVVVFLLWAIGMRDGGLSEAVEMRRVEDTQRVQSIATSSDTVAQPLREESAVVPRLHDDARTIRIALGDASVLAEVADDSEKRALGLSGRTGLATDTGMWFVHEQMGTYGFWMSGMLFPIDIIWFDDELRVVSIQEHASPESYPEIFKPSEPAQFILEVAAGYTKKHDIREGDFARILVD